MRWRASLPLCDAAARVLLSYLLLAPAPLPLPADWTGLYDAQCVSNPPCTNFRTQGATQRDYTGWQWASGADTSFIFDPNQRNLYWGVNYPNNADGDDAYGERRYSAGSWPPFPVLPCAERDG